MLVELKKRILNKLFLDIGDYIKIFLKKEQYLDEHTK